MKRLLLFFMALFFTFNVVALPISRQDAIRMARDFYEKVSHADINDITIVYGHKLKHFNHNAFYVCNIKDKGYVIIAGDDVARPVLAYSFEQGFNLPIPCNVKWYLDELADEIDNALLNDVSRHNRNRNHSFSSQSYNSFPNSVSPLLTTTWNQGTHYNEMCPETVYGNGRGNHVWAGCVATAMAQIIKYWSHPTNPRGWHQYESAYGTHTVDFDNQEYNYSLMPNSVENATSSSSKQQVQKLLYHCGVALDMIYDTSGSSAYDISIRSALVNYFKYSPQIGCASRISYSDSAWTSLIKNELVNGRPVQYSGSGETGHSFICDGYNSNDYFHFNFGWGGSYDGYFLLSAIEPREGRNYSQRQLATIEIEPDYNSTTYFSQKKGVSRYIVYDSVDVYDIKTMSSSIYGYSASRRHIMEFVSFDSSKHLAVVPISNSLGMVAVYTNDDTDPIINVNTQNQNSVDDVILTQSNMIRVVDTIDSLHSHFGFRLYVDDGCRLVSDLHINEDNGAVLLSWHENGIANGWEVEYGPEGFVIGQGTRISVQDTTTAIQGLQYMTTYDFYVRPLCYPDVYGEWSEKLSFLYEPPYWVDIVTSQPSGFVVDEDGNVEISSAEGLAWLISYVNGLNGQTANTMSGKTVTLTADVDLSPYKWTGITGFAGTMDGGNHIILNLLIYNPSDMNIGMFRTISSRNTTLKNIHFQNGIVVGHWFTGGICGSFYGLMYNCSYEGSVRGSLSTGGLIGRGYQGAIINRCYSSGNITGTDIFGSQGGLIGELRGSQLMNSYSSSGVSGRNEVGGLVGILYGGYISNCFYKGIVTGLDNVGGLIGTVNNYSNNNSILRNSYSDVIVTTNSTSLHPYIGGLVGRVQDTSFDYECYCYTSCSESPTIGNDSITHDGTLYHFSHLFSNNPIEQSLQIGDSVCTDLLDALNMYVIEEMDTTLKMWVLDSTGYPTFGDYYERCPEPSGLTIISMDFDEVTLAWNGNGGDMWQIEYGESGFQHGEGVYLFSDNPSVTIHNLNNGHSYDVRVRSICSDARHSVWNTMTFNACVNVREDYLEVCDMYTYNDIVFEHNIDTSFLEPVNMDGCHTLVNLHLTIHNSKVSHDTLLLSLADFPYNYLENKIIKEGDYTFTYSTIEGCDSIVYLHVEIDTSQIVAIPFWKDMVTSQPEGYHVGNDSCIYIYSSEGLAWLISVCNHYNGASLLPYYIKKVVLMTDVDMSDYLWTPVESSLSFDGHNHSITGLTIIDTVSVFHTNNGFLKNLYSNDTINNVLFDNCRIVCNNSYNTGGIAGTCSGTIINCGVSGTVTSKNNYVGGLVGSLYAGNVLNCYSTVDVAGLNYVGTAIGSGSTFQNTIKNCYSSGIVAHSYEYQNPYVGRFIGQANGSNNTEYIAYWHRKDTLFDGCGNDVAGFYPFDGSGTIWSLVDTVVLEGQTHSNLVDVLNEWVNANNDSGEYRRWTTDTNRINNGLPVFDKPIYLLSIGINDSVMGYSVGSGLYPEQTITTITAVPHNCYHFTHWSDGNTENPRSIIIERDAALTAYFEADSIPNGLLMVTSCDSYTWNGTTYTTSGIYASESVLQNTAGCDSTATLHLTINYSSTGSEIVTSCDSYTWNGTTYTTSGNYELESVLQNAVGCDSTVSLQLTIYYSSTVSEIVTSCDRYTWNGTTYTTSGNYELESVLLNAAGCDSTVTILLTIGHSSMISDTVSSCVSYTWNDYTFTSSGTYTYNSLTAEGCDSIHQIILTIYPSMNIPVTEMVCDSIIWHNQTYYYGGLYIFDTIDDNGCTQIDSLILTVNHSFYDTLDVTICDVFVWNGVEYNTSDNIVSYNTNTVNCDSVVTLNLTVNHSTSDTISITACNSYTWNGTTYFNSGEYNYNTTNSMGCDSVATLSLIIGNVITAYDSAVSCDSYQWNGTTYYSSGTYAYSTTSVGGCDSIVLLYLTINNSDTTGYETVVTCDSCVWSGNTYYESGIYRLNFQTVDGCDSIVTLNLTINHPTNNSFDTVVCDSIVWNGNLYLTGGIYLDTLVDANGCKQTDTLFLKLNHSVINYYEIGILSSDIPLEFNGTTITGSGDYTILLTTENNCDSIIKLNVIVYDVGIESMDNKSDIEIFPNPTDGIIRIIAIQTIEKIELFDAIGRLVYSGKESTSLEISHIPNGIYTLRISLPNTQYVKKIIKQ